MLLRKSFESIAKQSLSVQEITHIEIEHSTVVDAVRVVRIEMTGALVSD